ncbi:MAG TPA: dienelactone hydrolase family protein [Luteibacter sp.]|jgi:carboxymethylenebutenolidase|nr:dienelactone hydrolase family protein [Luteibacter sp.]
MQGEFIELVRIDGQPLTAYRALPAGGKGPAVVVLQEIFGVNVAMRQVADDLAAEGYVAYVPDLFWRLQPHVELGYDEAGLQEAFALWKRFDLAQGVDDVVQSIEAIRSRPEVDDKVAVLGFCLGGQLAAKVAARGVADAMLCFYGTRLGESLDEIASIAVPAIFHFGDADPHIPAEVREAVTTIAANTPPMSVTVHPGAAHGFFNAFREIGFHAQAHDLAWTQSLALLRHALRTPAAHHDRATAHN